MNREIFVQNVEKYCARRGVRPTVACAESGAGKDMINQIQRRGSVPSVDRVMLLAAYLGVTVGDLIGEASAGERGEILTPEEERVIRWFRALPAETRRAILALPDVGAGRAGT